MVSRRLDAETIVLNLETGTYLSLRGTAAELWRLREEVGDDEAVRRVSRHHDVDPSIVRSDLHDLVARLQAARAPARRARLRPVRIPPLRRWVLTPPLAWLALLEALSIALIVEIALRLVSVPRAARLLGLTLRFDRSENGDSPAAPETRTALLPAHQRALWATDRVLSAWPFPDTCLRRALILGFHLRRENPTLRIGISRTGEVLAHAWVQTPRMTLLALPDFASLVGSRLHEDAPLS